MEPELALILAAARKAAARNHVSVRAVIHTAMAASVCGDGRSTLDFIPVGEE